MAKEYLEHFATSYPDAEQVLNPEKPRRGAFNISITLESGSTVEVWDGRSKGPPRKLKFPDKDEILDKIKDEVSSS